MGARSVTSNGDAEDESLRSSTNVTYNGKQYNIAKEGAAEILDLQSSKDPKYKENKSQSVFYNPIQQYNRDLSVLAIKAFGEDLAAVRTAKYQRRAEQLAKGQNRGKKRKRVHNDGAQEDRAQEERATAVKENETQSQSTSLREESNATTLEVKDVGTGRETVSDKVEPTKIESAERQDKLETTGQERTDPEQDLMNGPKDPQNNTRPGKSAPFQILDALSATGLRALRYAKEIPMVTSVTANDLSASATASIRLNVEHNKISDKVKPNTSDAIEHMHYVASWAKRTERLYQVIDLDPYGTAAPFLDAAVQAIMDGGLLCVTCTDAGVFASLGYLEKTYSQYGGLPVKGPHAHEGGLRLILHAIATSAARYGLAVEPLLSLSIDFYARIFVRIHRSPAEVKFLASKTMVVYGCDTGCGAWTTQYMARVNKKEAKNGDPFYTFTQAVAPQANTYCEHCGFKTHQAGPMWGGPLHNQHFIQRILDMLPTLDKPVYGTIPRIEGMLSTALDETLDEVPPTTPKGASTDKERPVPPTDPATRSRYPFFFLPSALSKVIHCVSPSDAAVRGALIHLGYLTTRSHTKAGSICTNAPWNVIWEVMREWARQKSPVKEGAVKERTAGWGIMQRDRSRKGLNEVKESLRKAVDSNSSTDTDELRTELEAALYRLPRLEEGLEKAACPKSAAEGPVSTSLSDHDDIPEHMNGIENNGVPNNGSQGAQKSVTAPAQAEIPPNELEIVFDETLGKEPQGRRMVKYQVNPRPDWGPMNRAKGI